MPVQSLPRGAERASPAKKVRKTSSAGSSTYVRQRKRARDLRLRVRAWCRFKLFWCFFFFLPFCSCPSSTRAKADTAGASLRTSWFRTFDLVMYVFMRLWDSGRTHSATDI